MNHFTRFQLFFCLILCLFVGPALAQRPGQLPLSGTDTRQLSAVQLQRIQAVPADPQAARARAQAGPRRELFIAIDADNRLVTAFNGDVDLLRQTIFEAVAEASTLFERELNVKLTITEFQIWTAPDPYRRNDSGAEYLRDMLNWWNANRPGGRRHTVLGFSAKRDSEAGGYAVLGTGTPGAGAVIMAVTPTISINPTSYHTFVIARQLGHVLGAPTTSNCNWPGGPIDRCDRADGTCYSGPRVAEVGTIMSNCAAVAQFHPYSAALIKQTAEASLPVLNQAPAGPQFAATQLPVNRTDPWLTWSVAERAEAYRVQLAANEQFTQLLADSTVRFPQLQTAGLAPGTPYFARVRATNGVGESGWSTPVRISVAMPLARTAPKPLSPGRHALNVARNELVWAPIDGVTSYQVQLGANPQLTLYPERAEVRNESRYTLTNSFLATCSYCTVYWRVRATRDSSAADGGWSPIWQFRRPAKVQTSYPNEPQGLTTQFQLSVPIAWTDDTGEPGVSTVQLSKQPSFGQLLWSRTVAFNQPGQAAITENLMTMADSLEPATVYYYRIRTRYANGFETPWKAAAFRTGIDRRRWAYSNGANARLPMGNWQDMLVESTGAVWLATTQGIFRSADFRNWQPFTTQTTGNVLPNYVTAIGRGPTGNIWASTTEGVFRFNGTTWQSFGLPDPRAREFFANQLLIDAAERVYVVANTAVFLLSNGAWQRLTVPDNINGTFRSATLDKDNGLWLQTSGRGVARFNGTAWDFIAETTYPRGLFVNGIATDNSGALWLYGSTGIARLKTDRTWEFIASRDMTPTGQPGAAFRLLFDERNNPIVLSTRDLYRYTGSEWEALGNGFLSLGESGGWFGRDGLGRLYVATSTYGLSMYDVRTIRPGTITSDDQTAAACPGEALQIPFTLNYAPGAGNQFQVQLSDPTGVVYQTFPALISPGAPGAGAATVLLPATMPPGSNYRARIVSTNPAIFGDESATFTIFPTPTVRITPNADVAVCAGSSLTLRAESGVGATFRWQRDGAAISGATSSTLAVTQAGRYGVTVTQNGCQASAAPVAVTVKEGVTASITPPTSLTAYAPTTIALNANVVAGATYQWTRDGAAITGATSATFAAGQSGSYAVTITRDNGCAATATPVVIRIEIALATEPVAILGGLTLAPNPADRSCRVTFGRAVRTDVTLTLTDVVGRVVLQRRVPAGQTSIEVDVSQLGPGTYLLSADTDAGKLTQRLLKR